MACEAAPGSNFFTGGITDHPVDAMARMKRKRSPMPAPEEAEPEDVEQGHEAPSEETEDIYNEEQLDRMLKDDEITPSEYGFMVGREVSQKKKEEDPRQGPFRHPLRRAGQGRRRRSRLSPMPPGPGA